MKVTVSKKELSECIEGAIKKILSEKADSNGDNEMRKPRHQYSNNLDKQKGNKGNNKWDDFDDDYISDEDIENAIRDYKDDDDDEYEYYDEEND